MDSVSDYGYDTNTANPAATPSGGELNANSGNSLYPYVDYSEAVEGAIIIDEGEESTIKAAVVAPLVSTNATSGTPLAEASAHLDVAAPPTLAPPQFESLSQATPPSDYSVY